MVGWLISRSFWGGFFVSISVFFTFLLFNINQHIMLKNNSSLRQAVSPVLEAGLTLKQMRIILAEMYANSVSNPPENEIDAFSAKRQTPVFLALTEMLENLQDLE